MALITCPECNHTVSEFAQSCPSCGFPIKLSSIDKKPLETANTKPQAHPKRKKYKKLPNGQGSIKMLSGNRRKPYAAYPPCKGFQLNGSPNTSHAIGYYSTWHEAYTALCEYNKSPYDLSNPTFADVYKAYYENKYNGKKKYSKASEHTSVFAFKNCATLHSRKFRELRRVDYQYVLDSCPLKHASLEMILSLIKQMYTYAIGLDIVDKDYSLGVKINIADDDEKGEPFTDNDIDLLWQNKSDLCVQTILILIYSGFRISAWKTMEVNFDEQYFKGGVKTAAGKNRFVPIHPGISEMVCNETLSMLSLPSYRNNFYKTLGRLGIANSKNGKKHTPHDCRHTFSWLCDKYKVDDLSKHLLMGHSLGGDVEKSVYGHRTEDELRNELNKIKICY